MDWRKNYTKAITFTYDDGVIYDRKFVEILNRYGLRCTFNINTGFSSFDDPFFDEGILVSHLDVEEMVSLFQGHEVSVHTFTHPDLTTLNESEILYQIRQDQERIKQYFEVEACGMAYPFGTYNESVKKVVRESGLSYARTIHSTYDFLFPKDLYEFHPTIHHNDPRLFEIIDEFLNVKSSAPLVLSIWGHSYEFEAHQNWRLLEEICQRLSGHEEVFYGTNKEVLSPLFTK
ncbi:MAG: polysaccharide deacetylase family protein [Candidatus Izemoplasmatales bacterium]